MYKHTHTAPLSIKLALVTAAVGAGCAAPAQAAFISTAPTTFKQVTSTSTTASTYSIDIDQNTSPDFVFGIASYNGLDYVTLTGTDTKGRNVIVNTQYVDLSNVFATAFNVASGFASPDPFPVSTGTNTVKMSQSVAIGETVLGGAVSSAMPYIDVQFTDANQNIVRGYLEGSITTTAGHIDSFTLTDFGLVTDDAKVPEPGSLALLAAGAAGIGALRRRRRSARAV